MAKVIITEAVVSSGLVNPLSSATMERISIEVVTVRPIGTEYSMILVTKRFLMRSVLCSRARTNPGKPIQAKLRSDISIGIYG